jgi:hypothetical protein
VSAQAQVGWTIRQCLSNYVGNEDIPVFIEGVHDELSLKFRWKDMDVEVHFPGNKDVADAVEYHSKVRFSDEMISSLLSCYGTVQEVQPDKQLGSDPHLDRRAWVVRKNKRTVIDAISNAVFNTEGSYPDRPDYYWLSVGLPAQR